MTVWVTNQSTVLNTPQATVVLVPHPKHTACVSCGCVCAPNVGGVKGWDVLAVEVPPKEQEQRIVQPG
jgi:hypothetical protein